MPGQDENKVDNQEPTNEENKQEEGKSEPENYEERVFGAITGVINSSEE